MKAISIEYGKYYLLFNSIMVPSTGKGIQDTFPGQIFLKVWSKDHLSTQCLLEMQVLKSPKSLNQKQGRKMNYE